MFHTTGTMPSCVMIFSATDPTCGAGMQADILTCASLNVQTISVITGITVQDTVGVARISSIASDLLWEQAEIIFQDILKIDIFKLGMLSNAENAKTIASILQKKSHIPVVFDPILRSGRGDELASMELQKVMKEEILPLTTLVTPNSLEARQIAFAKNYQGQSLEECAKVITGKGAKFVLIKGAHEMGETIVHTLYDQNGIVEKFFCERLPGEFHGSGCTFASAIASFLALACDIPNAIEYAQAYTYQTLQNAVSIGGGQKIPQRTPINREVLKREPKN